MKRRNKLLTHSAAFTAFDDVEEAKDNLEGTFELFTCVLNSRATNPALLPALERHFAADLAALEAAIGRARSTILSPLHAKAYPSLRAVANGNADNTTVTPLPGQSAESAATYSRTQ